MFLCMAVFTGYAQKHVSRLDSVQRLNEVVVLGNSQRSVIPSQQLKGEELQRLNSLSVADALRFFAGVQLKDYGGVGGIKTVNIRSMGTNHVGVFYDGIQLSNAQNGQVDLGMFSLDNMQAISLYNGQKSQIFQSAKDFNSAGSIYMWTRRPVFADSTNYHLKATLKTGSFDLVNPALLIELRLSDKVSASFSGEWLSSSGKYKFRYRRKAVMTDEIMYDTTAVRQNGDVRATRMEGALFGTISGGEWMLKAYNYTSERGVPGAIVNNVWRRGERIWDNNSFVQGSIQKDFGSRYHTRLMAKYAYYLTKYVNKDTTVMMIDNVYRQKELYLSSSHLYNITNFWDVSAAYDVQWNTMDADIDPVSLTTEDGTTVSLKDVATDADNMDAAIVKTVKEVSDEEVLKAEMADGDLVITPLKAGKADITIQINSNGKLAETVVSVEVTEATDIDAVEGVKAEETGRYTLDGKMLNAPQRGINIIRMSDGTIKKVIVR